MKGRRKVWITYKARIRWDVQVCLPLWMSIGRLSLETLLESIVVSPEGNVDVYSAGCVSKIEIEKMLAHGSRIISCEISSWFSKQGSFGSLCKSDNVPEFISIDDRVCRIGGFWTRKNILSSFDFKEEDSLSHPNLDSKKCDIS